MNFKVETIATGTIDHDIKQKKYLISRPSIIYILDGIFDCKINGKDTKVVLDDFVLLNSGDQVELTSSEAVNLILYLEFNIERLSELLSINDFYFNNEKKSKHNQQVSVVIKSMLKAISSDDSQLNMFAIGRGYELANLLILNYAGMQLNGNKEKDSMKAYIRLHFSDEMDLEKVAHHFFMEPSYFSKYFKKQTGVNFKDFVTNERLAHAENTLLSSNQLVAQVALNNGFNSLSSFNRAFKIKYHMTPTDYRKKYQLSIEDDTVSSESKASWGRTRTLLTSSPLVADNSSVVNVKVTQDDTKKSYVPDLKMILNLGNIENNDSDEWKEHIDKLMESVNFKFARICVPIEWFTDADHFPLKRIRRLVDYCLVKHLTPWITINISDASIIPESIYSLKLVLSSFGNYLNENLVEKWRFEIQFSTGNVNGKDVVTAYRLIKSGIKQVLPNAMVGGIGENLVYTCQLYEAFSESDFDFITCRYFWDESELNTNEDKFFNFNSTFVESQNLLQDRLTKLRANFAGPIFISEIGMYLGAKDYLQDTLFSGAYLIDKIAHVAHLINGFGYVLGSDIFQASFNLNSTVTAGPGLLTDNGIIKPSLTALKTLDEFFSTSHVSKLSDEIFAGYVDNDIYILGYDLQVPLFTAATDLSDPRNIKEHLPKQMARQKG